MKKDLPKIFKNEIKKTNSSNKEIYYSINSNQNSSELDKKDDMDRFNNIEDKLKKLFKSSRYIFNIGVIIKTDKKDYDTKIAGKIKNSIITVDNEVIPIIEINDIILKDRT